MTTGTTVVQGHTGGAVRVARYAGGTIEELALGAASAMRGRSDAGGAVGRAESAAASVEVLPRCAGGGARNAAHQIDDESGEAGVAFVSWVQAGLAVVGAAY